MEEEKIYECAYCGTKYDNPTDRARCELRCANAARKNAEIERKEHLKKERETREKELVSQYEILKEKINEFRKDYGTYPLKMYDNGYTSVLDWFMRNIV